VLSTKLRIRFLNLNIKPRRRTRNETRIKS
jgi:hypothetical protein